MKELEAAILAELKQVAQNSKLRQKDIMEWRTGENNVKVEAGETYYYLPGLGVSCAVVLPVKSGPTLHAPDKSHTAPSAGGSE